MKKLRERMSQKANEGFSLVELIIVIAIMAILIGIIALQVIPYMEKSRESKDLSQIDTAYSAFQTAIADQAISGDIAATKYTGATTQGTTEVDKIQYSMQQNLGLTGAELTAKLVSKNCVGQSVYFEKTGTTIKVFVSSDGSAIVKGEYNQKEMASSNK